MITAERDAGRETGELEQRLRGVEGASRQAAGGLGGVRDVFAGGLLAGAVQETLGQVKQLAADALALAGTLDDLSAKTGVTAEGLQLIGNAASQDGVPLETVGRSLNQLTKTAAQAADGNKALAASYKSLEIEVGELRGLSGEQIFLLLADAVAGASDKSKAFADVSAVMGRGAQELFGTLNKGQGDITALSESMGILGDESVKNLAEAQETLERFGNRLKVLAGDTLNIVGGLLSGFADVTRDSDFTGLFSRVFGLSSEEIAKFEEAEKLALLQTEALQGGLKTAAGDVEDFGAAVGKAKGDVESLDKAMSSRNLANLPATQQVDALKAKLAEAKKQADELFKAEGQAVEFKSAADLSVIANQLGNGKLEAKQLAAEMAKYEDALKRVSAEQNKAAAATSKASAEATKAIDSELAALRQKQALLAEQERTTLNAARADQLQAEQRALQAQIDRRGTGGAPAAPAANASQPAAPPSPAAAPAAATAQPLTPPAAAAGQAAATATERALGTLLEQLRSRVESLRLTVEEAQQSLPQQLTAIDNSLAAGFSELAAAAVAIPPKVDAGIASVQAAIEGLAGTIEGGFASLASATAAADAQLARRIDQVAAQVAALR